MAAENIIFSWSGGKDSAFALYEVLKSGKYKVKTLLTSVTEDYDRISMHGVRRVLLEEQARALGLPVHPVLIPKNCTNSDYEKIMERQMKDFKDQGIAQVAFADIFLEDLKKYREEKLARAGMSAVFPIWKSDTSVLSKKFIDLGFKAIITCLDSEVIDKKFAGRIYDYDLLSELPDHADPCGENGEFHSFVFDGPIFQKPVEFVKGEVVLRDERFYFCDLEPVD